MFKLFEVREGKFKVLPSVRIKNIRGFFIVSFVAIIIAGLAGTLKLNEKDLWKIYNLLIARFNLQHELPEVKNNEKQLEAQIELEVDKAIREYESLTGDDGTVRLPSPQYSEKSVDTDVCYTDECRALGGEMRLCAPWVDNCPSGMVD
jgi:hypothetical protein